MDRYTEQQIDTAVRHALDVWANTEERDIDAGTTSDVNKFTELVMSVVRMNYADPSESDEADIFLIDGKVSGEAARRKRKARRFAIPGL